MGKKVWILLLAFLLLGMLAWGCGSPEPAPQDVGEEDAVEEEVDGVEEDAEVEEAAADGQEQAEGALLEIDTWAAPGSLEEMVSTFQEIRHSWTMDGAEEFSMHYLYEGSETYEGVEVDKAKFDIAGEAALEIWMDSDGNFKRVLMDGEELPSEMAGMFVDSFVQSILLPFNYMADWGVQEALASTTAGLKTSVLQSGEEKIGELTALVHTVEFTIEPPLVPQGERAAGEWRVADFGDFQTVVGWKVFESAGEEFNLEFNVDTIVMR